MNPTPPVTNMRTPLGRARGLGTAHSGVHHWWQQRLTSLALLPLTLWFVISILRLARAGLPQMLHWSHQPLNAVLAIAFILATFHHLAAGLQVVIEDYIRGAARIATLLCMKAGCALLALACLLSVLKLAL